MFESLTIIDLSTVLAAPSVGTFFAELGASVIKIEHPLVPDVTRSWKLNTEKQDSTISAYFASVNYKKEYRQLNLTLPTDRSILFELLKTADILLSNFKKGDDVKFGLTSDELSSRFPSLIHGKISGFGNDSDRVAYDLILQAETGFMSMNGTPDSGPIKMPVAFIDVLAAHQLKEGILISLLNRIKTGMGSEVSVSLYDAALCSLANQASNFLMAGHLPKRIGSLHPNIAPYGELFTTKDAIQITFAIGSNKHFSSLCAFLNHSDWTEDARFSDNVSRVLNRIVLAERLGMELKKRSVAEITEFCEAHFIPMARIKDLNEVLNEESAQKLIRTEVLEGITTKRMSQVAFKIN